eukprot:CAMPEP_0176504858 /NCGR_PEP_ID=MMETSP0200_2-20121128/16177_1 /TAXON_ID=947934 /ORGANISM="Chaetoceros sp., Strain GSL56" /LENGTH=742 /DNA_ID=CAMNT_0017904357 /DNA_START=56 /DNA_END=2281 /DNA_ORIENTATION=+
MTLVTNSPFAVLTLLLFTTYFCLMMGISNAAFHNTPPMMITSQRMTVSQRYNHRQKQYYHHVPRSFHKTRHPYSHPRSHPIGSRLMATDNSTVEKLQQQANKMKLEAEKLEAELNLEKIQKLERAIGAVENIPDEKKRSQKLSDIRADIKALASRIDPSVLESLEKAIVVAEEEKMNSATSSADSAESSRVSTETNLYAKRKRIVSSMNNDKDKDKITKAELAAAVEIYVLLPKSMRRALARAIDLDENRTDPAIVVLNLFDLRDSLSDERLQKLYMEELSREKENIGKTQQPLDKAENTVPMLQRREPDDPFNPFSYPDANNIRDVNTMVENFLPRQTRKEGMVPTKEEAEMFAVQVLGKVGKKTFQPSGPMEPVSGGFLIRGKMVSQLKEDGDKLIELLDESIVDILPKEWSEKYQVSYIVDPTPQMLVDDNVNGSPVLLVHGHDMSPSINVLLTTGVSSVSLFLTFVFALSIFGQNDTVMQRITEAQGQQDYDLTWFNQLITPYLVALGITQVCHELSHLVVAKKDGFKITPPTILPLLTLPYLSFQNRIKTSPKNLSSLFNFAFAGPAVGMAVSLLLLILGLQMTMGMTPEQVQYSPSVPVGFLKLSSLGANIVDYILGGGDGIILQQDPNTPVLLHPFAIAGFSGLMINAIDSIPLAGTDGGRMSQALLGRPGHTAFSGLIYFGLLLYTVFSGHQDIFLSYLFVTSFTQRDLEVPARNEVDQAGIGQAALALIIWSV